MKVASVQSRQRKQQERSVLAKASSRRLLGRVNFLLVVGLSAGVASWAQDPPQDLSSLTIEQLMNVQVEGAALHPQTLEEAPASVSIITAEDIRKYGYRTLGEALASVRGFYTSYNRSYTTVGVRGFQLPGDYASRFLVMVNGHNMADNVLNYMLFFGPDFPIEMNLIKRIEIIRGPSSALYGSNGIFATINIITKSPDEVGPLSLTTDIGSFGEKKAQVTAVVPIGKQAKLLISGSIFNNNGESPLFFPEFNAPATNNGLAVRMDNEKGYHFFSNLTWRNWSVMAQFSDRDKIQPISWGNVVFNDRGTNVNDSRNFVEAAYTRELASGTLRWRTYYDSYRYQGRADYPLDLGDSSSGIEDNRTLFDGKWIGTELTYRFDVAHVGALTVGGEGKIDLRNLQRDQDVWPASVQYLNVSRPDRSLALFAQDERRLSDHWTLNVGARLDVSVLRQSSTSPRVALIFQPSSVWTYKFLYGRGFRNPSAFELFYGDGLSGLANPQARPEKADTFEVDMERKIGKRMRLVTAAYHYRLRDLLVGTRAEKGLLQYQNVGKIHATGFEIEINGRLSRWLEATASYAIQKSVDDVERDTLENSPDHLAKLHFAIPLGHKFEVSSGMQYYSARLTFGQAIVAPVYLADLTITARRLLPNFDAQFGIRNAFNRNYFDPIALDPRVDAMRQPGRAFFVRLIAHGRDELKRAQK
jgi:outer membrane receptor for ferrienterochelin and colicins